MCFKDYEHIKMLTTFIHSHYYIIHSCQGHILNLKNLQWSVFTFIYLHAAKNRQETVWTTQGEQNGFSYKNKEKILI